MTTMRDFITQMPKCELHVHIEGTLEPDLKLELATRNGVELRYRNAKELKAAYHFDDLPSFLAVYYEGMSVLLKEADFYDVTLRLSEEGPRAECPLHGNVLRSSGPHGARHCL
jgi:adenosine deaminase